MVGSRNIMDKHINIKIYGHVWGVGFRFCAYEKMVELGLPGKAENVPEGVLVDTEGPEEKLEELVKWCHVGPSGARVSRVEVVEAAGPFVPLKMG
jgi:acylphosphatase